MVKFLINRPIAVLMTFTACFILGFVTYSALPVSLLPDIEIPQITVQVRGDNISARELENTVVNPVRQSLMQVSGMEELSSETRDGSGIIRLSYEFGTNTDLAFIEVNEKIDEVMNRLPKNIARPRAIKASATDIPVFYLNMTLKDAVPFQETEESAFLEMCDLAENVVKRRIEQLPQVAMADITGVPQRMLSIIPDLKTMETLGMKVDDLERILSSNNVEPGSMLVRDGYYEYNIRIASVLRTPEDVENIYFNCEGRILQLKDIANVKLVTKNETGRSLAGGKRAVTLAIIKQNEEKIDNLKVQLQETMEDFRNNYPQVEFGVSRNQTELLDYSISNLQQNFGLGFLFIFIVALLFIGDLRSPLIIGIVMISSVVITFFFFYLCRVSLNVISLSGLILVVGMMIDNAIIVTENITQYQERGVPLNQAVIKGTSEMITPMLSSSLTTVAVFIPLVFMSGIAGAIFMDEAFSITSGLVVSYITGITLLPVLYVLFYRISSRKYSWLTWNFKSALKNNWLQRFYDAGINWVFLHKRCCLLVAVLTLPVSVAMFFLVEKERMPKIDQNEMVVDIEWNENIHVAENNRRVNLLLKKIDQMVEEHTAYVGMQDYVLNSDKELSVTEAELYFKLDRPEKIRLLKDKLQEELNAAYPHAVVEFLPPVTIFEKLFVTGSPEIVAQLYPADKSVTPDLNELSDLKRDINSLVGLESEGIQFRKQMNLEIDRNRLLIYNVDYDEVVHVLRSSFHDNQVSTLRSFQQYFPICIIGKEQSVNKVLAETFVQARLEEPGSKEVYVPLRDLVKVVPDKDLKQITAGRNGEFIPINFYDVDDAHGLMNSVKSLIEKNPSWNVSFSGSFFSNKKMLGELVLILVISILLMYFILCSQFESFFQPLIVLAEIPMDIAFGLLLLWITGHTVNLMSVIGLIVSCGIVVNDSILKLDSINELRKSGMPVLEAIHEAGHRRLRAIIMTTLTTVFAMVPLLFTHDFGSELQAPLSVAMIGTMMFGLFISLFVIPLIYWYIYRRYDVQNS